MHRPRLRVLLQLLDRRLPNPRTQPPTPAAPASRGPGFPGPSTSHSANARAPRRLESHLPRRPTCRARSPCPFAAPVRRARSPCPFAVPVRRARSPCRHGEWACTEPGRATPTALHRTGPGSHQPASYRLCPAPASHRPGVRPPSALASALPCPAVPLAAAPLLCRAVPCPSLRAVRRTGLERVRPLRLAQALHRAGAGLRRLRVVPGSRCTGVTLHWGHAAPGSRCTGVTLHRRAAHRLAGHRLGGHRLGGRPRAGIHPSHSLASARRAPARGSPDSCARGLVSRWARAAGLRSVRLGLASREWLIRRGAVGGGGPGWFRRVRWFSTEVW